MSGSGNAGANGKFVGAMALQLAWVAEQLGYTTATYGLEIAALSIDEDLPKKIVCRQTDSRPR